MFFKAAGRIPAIWKLLFSSFALGVVDNEPAAGSTDGEGTQDDETPPAGADDGSGGEDANATDDDDAPGGDEAIAVAIGAEPSPGSEDNEDDLIDGQPAPQWVKDLRKKAKDDARELRELRAKLAVAPQTVTPAETDPGEKPTLEGCDFDAEKFEANFAAWVEKKAKADQAKKDAEAKAQADKDAWQAKLQAFANDGAALKVPDFQDAQDAATAELTPIQQSIIINGASKPALLVYALGKDPAKLKELAAIKDPVKFAFAAAAIEKDIRVAPRKKQIPAPETRVTGSAGTAHVDGTLERLRKEAERTNDYTKVHAYKRSKAAKK